MADYSIINSVVSKRFYTIYTTYHTKVYQTQISQVQIFQDYSPDDNCILPANRSRSVKQRGINECG
ncbi:Uncharacterised protein [Phocaeicola vulgatus]|nr:Uncharacterised protein [Phocaeicola vulgatus]